MIRYPLYVTIDTNIFDSIGYDLGDDGKCNRCIKQTDTHYCTQQNPCGPIIWRVPRVLP